MSYHKLWFRQTAKNLKLLHPYPEFSKIQGLVKSAMPQLITDLKAEGEDLNDPQVWWQALYMDALLLVENSAGESFKIAVGLQDKWKPALNAHRTISSPTFQKCRERLDIDQHWLFYVTSKYPYGEEVWIDLIYAQVDREPPPSTCVLLDVDA
ncbi:hypothetical protein [Synechococcus sp. PCC 6312]|uniref:hypothetical protein n=1 Tax=Synechococcus sp. (strain ATCC 27167 / PCC 6312) TaxID=195253 RepID=UPI00029EED32|nr:hypothetical protein [Synechococcus sp. PCC 6312]AFY62658.1 hypothetical protein Syn6312_3642 [Synechococcus sp. PCC 6312]